MLMTLALLTTPGNKAQGQSVPSVAFTEQASNSTSQTIASTGQMQYHGPAQPGLKPNGHGPVPNRGLHSHGDNRRLHRGQRTLYFYPGTTERTISVTVLDDTAVEANERFYIQLTSPTDAVLDPTNLHK